MKFFATIILSITACLSAIGLFVSIFLGNLSKNYHLIADWNSYSTDSKTHFERYIQFTGTPNILLFGFKAQDAQSDIPPFTLSISPVTPDELERRQEYSLTQESKNKASFTLGFSRMLAHPEGQNFRGDYVSVKISVFYVIFILGLLISAFLLVALYKKTEQDAAANP